MPIVLIVLTAIGGAIWWWIRNNPRDALNVADDLVTSAINAPRRLAFRRQTNLHPVDGIDDPRIAVAAIAQGYIELSGLPTKDDRDRLHVLLRSRLRLDEEEAEEMEVLGRWLITQCNGAEQAITKLGRRLKKLDGDASWETLQNLLADFAKDGGTAAQRSAVGDLKVLFGKSG